MHKLYQSWNRLDTSSSQEPFTKLNIICHYYICFDHFEKYYTFSRFYLYFEEELHLNKKVSKMATWPSFDRILNWIIKSLNEENRKSAALTKKDDRNVIREKERERTSPFSLKAQRLL